MNVNCIVTMGLVPEIKYLVSCIKCKIDVLLLVLAHSKLTCFC